jgi:hypothetical protein
MVNTMNDFKQFLFADKDGRLVFGQKPNLPIIVWAVAKVAQLLPLPTLIADLLALVAFGALFTWAWLEMFQGACRFRRLLGWAVMILLLSVSL